jgi:hypothetical protein
VNTVAEQTTLIREFNALLKNGEPATVAAMLTIRIIVSSPAAAAGV